MCRLFCFVLYCLIVFQLLQLVNREMFWVVTEVCSEHNLVRRSKIIKQFIKVASKLTTENMEAQYLTMSGKLTVLSLLC